MSIVSRVALSKALLQRVLECDLERTDQNSQQLRHLRVLNSMLLIAMGLCPAFGLFWWQLVSRGFLFLYAATFLAWGATFWIVRKSHDPIFGGRLACFVLYLLTVGSAFLLGGAQSFSLAWLMVLPVAGAVCVGRRDVWGWAAISGLTILGFALAPTSPDTMSPVRSLNDPSSVTSLIAGVAVVAILTSVWHAFQSDLENRLDLSLARLQGEIDAKELLVEIATVSSSEDSVETAARMFLDLLDRSFSGTSARYWIVSDSEGDTRWQSLSKSHTSQGVRPFEPGRSGPSAGVLECYSTTREGIREIHGEAELCMPVFDTGRVIGILELRCAPDTESVGRSRSIVRQMALRLAEVGLRESAAKAVWKEAHHDHLTQLPNRRGFHGLLETVLEGARKHDRRAALLFVDLNGFKRINDSFGHGVGDEVLQHVSRRLKRCLRMSDVICGLDSAPISRVSRVGGDEFTVVLDEIVKPTDAEIVAERVLKSLRDPILIDQREVHVGASIGIAIFPDDSDSIDGLIHCADTSMYTAKRRGTSGYARYRQDQKVSDDMTFESEMRRALAEKQLRMQYQPIFDTETGRLVAAEALMRWPHPEKGFISPGHFIPVAERLGMMSEFGKFQFEAALSWYEASRDALPESFRLSLNLSPTQLEDSEFVVWLAERLATSELPMKCIELEITETALMNDTQETRDHLSALAGLGLTIALDDFGTGQSSLSLLKRFPIRRIKLDRSFVAGLPDRPDDVAIVTAVIGLSKGLGVPLVAEGVEDEAQHLFLAERGCDEMQGFLFGRPVDGADFLRSYEKTATIQPGI